MNFSIARRYTAAAWRHRWKALALTWFVCLVGWGGIYLLPNQYQSNARVYADADAILRLLLRGIAIDSTPAGQVEILQRTLLSRPNLERIIARTDLDNRASTPTEREALIASLGRDIRIVQQTRNLFSLEYRDQDPDLARAVIQTALNLFIESATATDRLQMDNARSFVNQQISSYETQLREAERRRAEFQARYVELLPSEALGGATRLEAARSRVQQIRGDLVDARTRRALTERQLAVTPSTPPVEATAGARATEADRRLAELRQRYTDEHPAVIAARNQAAAARGGGTATGGGRAQPRINPAYELLQLRLIDSDAQIASLERQERDAIVEVTRLEALARSVPEVQAEYTNLDRDYAVLRRNYEELLARRESLQIAGAARTSSDRIRLEIVDPPTLPTIPVSPNRVLLAIGVLLGGLGVGAALAVVLVTLDSGFYTVQDLRSLGLPVLGGFSAAERSRGAGGVVVFACGLLLLFASCGAILAGIPAHLLRSLA